MLPGELKVERDWWSKVLLYAEMKEALCPNLFQGVVTMKVRR